MSKPAANWKIMTMSELWDEIHPVPDGIFIKPQFPTRRWGQAFSINSTTCKETIAKLLAHYQAKGIKVRCRKDNFTTDKYKKKLGIFYFIEIQL